MLCDSWQFFTYQFRLLHLSTVKFIIVFNLCVNHVIESPVKMMSLAANRLSLCFGCVILLCRPFSQSLLYFNLIFQSYNQSRSFTISLEHRLTQLPCYLYVLRLFTPVQLESGAFVYIFSSRTDLYLIVKVYCLLALFPLRSIFLRLIYCFDNLAQLNDFP